MTVDTPFEWDVTARDFGSIWVLSPNTNAATHHFLLMMPEDAATWGNGYVVEPQYVGHILTDLEVEGYSVEIPQ